jgi:hypothetical protein
MLVVLLVAAALTGCYAETRPATDVTATSAKLHARGHTDSTPAQVYFEYATSAQALGTSAAFTTPRRSVPANVPDTAFSQTVKALLPSTTYWFRVCGRDGNSGGDICNSSRSFTTSAGSPEVSFREEPAFTYTTHPSDADPDLDAADFNRDGKLDLVVASGQGAAVRLGDGNGGFGSPSQSVSGLVDTALGGDMNKDAKPDLITAGIPGGTDGLAVQLGNGTGGFGGAFSRVDTDPALRDAILRDFDRDADLDLAGVSDSLRHFEQDPSTARLFRGDGNGHLAGSADLDFNAPHVGKLEAADVNSDGRLDLVGTVNTEPDPERAVYRLATLLGNGDLTFAAPILSANPSGPGMVLGDFDRDGRVDAAVHGAVLRGNGQGSFGNPVAFSPPLRPLLRGDFNRDGVPDLVVPGQFGPTVLLGEGDGTFRTPASFTGGLPLLLADFNRDGKPDIVVVLPTNSDFTGWQVNVLLNTAP